MERDEVAERVVDALRRELPATSRDALGDDALLAAPLPQEPGEGSGSDLLGMPGKLAGLAASVENKMSKDRGRDRTSFQELAKLASLSPPPPSTSSAPTPPPASVVRGDESNENDSGIVDLKAIASADPSGAHRAASTPLATQGLFDDDAHAPASAAPPQSIPAVASAVGQTPAPVAVTASAPPPSAVMASQPPSAAAAMAGKKQEKKSGGGLVLLFGGLVAAAAIAAGGFFVFKHLKTEPAATTSVAANTPPVDAPKATATAAATVAANDTTAANDVDLDSLPQGGSATPGGKSPATTTGIVAPKATATGGAAPPPAGSVDPRLVVNNIPQGGGGGGGDLTNAMQAAAGGGSSTAATANTASGPQYAPGSVPQKPSQGQVAGAIGAVLPDAKHCLNEGDPISRASVVFKSDGSVQAVSVTGFAAGKPAEACIKAALGKAKVSPFAEATYSFPVTVRP